MLERIDLDRIDAEARQVHLGRVLLTVLGAVFYVIGWVIGAAVTAFVWSYAAAKVGYQDARNPQTVRRRVGSA